MKKTLPRAPKRERSLARDEQPNGDDNADLADGQEQRSKSIRSHSQIIIGRASIIRPPQTGDPVAPTAQYDPDQQGTAGDLEGRAG